MEKRHLQIRETVRQVRCVSWTAALQNSANLSMFIFNVQEVRGREFKTHVEGYEYLKKQGVPVIE